ncbi:hypothetical protein H0H93_002057, partial [Arthromyces matolae]
MSNYSNQSHQSSRRSSGWGGGPAHGQNPQEPQNFSNPPAQSPSVYAPRTTQPSAMDVDDDNRRQMRPRTPPHRRRHPSPRRYAPRPSSPSHRYPRDGPSRDRRQHMPRSPSPQPRRNRAPSPQQRMEPRASTSHQHMEVVARGASRTVVPSRVDDHALAELMQRLENIGRQAPEDASFMHHEVAIEFIGGLVDDIELLRRQRQRTLGTLSRVEKRRAVSPEEVASEPKKPRHGEEVRQGERLPTPGTLNFSSYSNSPIPMSELSLAPSESPSNIRGDAGVPVASTMVNVPVPQNAPPSLPAVPVVVAPVVSTPTAPAAFAGAPTPMQGLDASIHAPGRRRRAKRAIDESTLTDVTFPPFLPQHAGPTVLRFSPAIDVPAPPPTYPTVIVPIDPRKPQEYDGTPSSYSSDEEDVDSDANAPPTQHELQQAQIRQERVTGRIPDLLGVMISPDGMVE